MSRSGANCSVKMRAQRQSESRYLKRREHIWDRLSRLPQGTIKERLISGRKYYYLQRREGKKVIHTYIGKEIPGDLKKQFEERNTLRKELGKINDILMSFVSEAIKRMM